jgi:protoheme IX farnesyltransferase
MFRDYVNLMKLRIASLLLLVAGAGYLVTSGPRIDLLSFSLLMVSGLLASAGASAMNCYVDRDVDGTMERTKRRPLPTGRIEPPERALVFGLVLTAAGLALAAVGINLLTAAFILAGAVVYVGVYTVGLKRRSVANIVIGGAAGSFPALAGAAAAANGVSLGALLIAVLVFLWTPGHFWALAFGRRAEYRAAGLPMMPAVRSEGEAALWIALSNATLPPVAVAFFFLDTAGWMYLLVALAASGVLLRLTVRFLRTPTEAAASAGYRFSGAYLSLLLVALILEALVPPLL